MLKALPARARIALLGLAGVAVLIVLFQNGGDTLNILFWPDTPAWLGVFVMSLIGFGAGFLCATYLLGSRRGQNARD
ncbi:MAG: hypothetical protein V5A84_01890 [Planctomycetota bacterium]